MSEDYRNVPVKFFYRDVKQNFESKKQGKPIWKTCEFISIMKPGNSKDIMEREVSELDKERWGKLYDAWKNREEQIQSGTRIEVLPGIEQNKIELCKRFNIYTLEQLTNIDEEGVENLGDGARDLIRDAKKYIQGSTAVNEMQKEVDAIKIENKKLIDENKELKERIDDLINNGAECSERDTAVSSSDNGNRKRGRIRKAVPVVSDQDRVGAASAA